jgi:hypothetical protein
MEGGRWDVKPWRKERQPFRTGEEPGSGTARNRAQITAPSEKKATKGECNGSQKKYDK